MSPDNNEESDLHQSQFSKLTETALQQLTGDVIQGVIYRKRTMKFTRHTFSNYFKFCRKSN